MRDEIKQMGRYVRDNSERRDIALRRTAPIIPITDRVRDIFEDVAPTSMHFNVPKDDTRVNLDIRFLRLPLNTGSLCGNCHCRTSESFYADQTIFIVAHPFEDSSTIRVYVNNIRTTNFITTDVDTIELLDVTVDTDVVTITYVYVIDLLCDEGTDIPEFTGDVFAGIIRTSTPNDDKSQIVFAGTYLPLAPYLSGTTVGPVHLNQTPSPYYTSITVEEPMTVRIVCHTEFGGVYIPPKFIETKILVNGVQIAETGYSSSGGFGEHFFDIHNYTLQAGDTVSIDGTGDVFWTNYGDNYSTYLLIVRGTFEFLGAFPDWVGP